jgi:hypothetical protein
MEMIILKRVDGVSLDKFLPKRKDLKIIIECPICNNVRQSNSYDVLKKQSTVCIKCCDNKPKDDYAYRRSYKYRNSMRKSMLKSQAWKDAQFLRQKGAKKYWEKVRGCKLEDIYDEWTLYRKMAYLIMEKNYKKWKEIINPSDLPRGRKKYHVDHKYSVLEGFKNNILPSIISNPSNLEMIYYKDNLSKDFKCTITKKQLMEGVLGT